MSDPDDASLQPHRVGATGGNGQGEAATPSSDATSPPTAARVERPYPRRPLEQALRVATVIKEKNAGRPWPPDQIAEALQIKAKSSNFTYILGAAREYGLTRASSDSGVSLIELTALGQDVAFPKTAEAEQESKVEAFLRVDSFRKLLEYYGGNNLPEWKFLANILQTTFGLDPATHEEFVELFDKNCRFLGIGHDWKRESPASKNGRKPIIIEGSVIETRGSGPGTVVRSRDQTVSCFVIMPFTERDERHEIGFFTEVFESLFKPALAEIGFDAYTALQQGSDVIQATIVNELLRADMVLADLTEHNPNVLFELGMRMHAEKPVALVRAKGTGPIFDVDSMLRVLEYNPNLWSTTIALDRPKVAEHVKATWENRSASQSFMSILKERSTER